MNEHLRGPTTDGRHRRKIALATVAVATLGFIGWGVVGPNAEAGVPGLFRPAEKTKTEVLRDLAHLDGEKNVVAPDSAPIPALLKDSELKRHGSYRIVPPNLVGPLSKSDAGRKQPAGIKSNDASVLRQVALYVEVKGLPPDFTQTSMDTGDGDSNTVLRQTFAGADSRRRTLEVVRVARNQEPLDVFEPPQDQSGWLTLSTITVGGHEGILLSPSKFSPIPAEAQLVRVQFFAGGVETILTATGLTPDEVVVLATRIAEGGR